jgi:radical SAM superfamily enzyme YgiQ (UPF0313 family)
MYHEKIRHRPLHSALRDVDNNSGYLFFTDDNLHADATSLRDILHELRHRNRLWSCQISADIIKQPDLVSLMAKAGCVSVTIGFESLERKNLKQMGKSWMEADYRHIVRVFHDNGIMVYGTFIIGYDHDTLAVFDRTLAFALEARLLLANFNPLIPTPGTPLYSRLESEGRLLFDRWWLHSDYRWGDCVFRPAHMSPEELTAGCFRLRKAFHSGRNILARFPGLKAHKTTFRKAGLFVAANIVSRRELSRKYGKALGDSSSMHEFDLETTGAGKCM